MIFAPRPSKYMSFQFRFVLLSVLWSATGRLESAWRKAIFKFELIIYCNFTQFISTRSHIFEQLLVFLIQVGLRWCHLRLVSLQADDSKSPVFPLVWLPSGILMFHHNSHIYLFSQWSSNHYASNRSPSTFTRPFKEDVDSGVVSVEAARLKAIYSNLHLTKLLTKQELQSKSYLKKFQENPNHFTESFYDNLGLFEAARVRRRLLGY